jgi:hypothetical protein
VEYFQLHPEIHCESCEVFELRLEVFEIVKTNTNAILNTEKKQKWRGFRFSGI